MINRQFLVSISRLRAFKSVHLAGVYIYPRVDRDAVWVDWDRGVKCAFGKKSSRLDIYPIKQKVSFR